MKKLCVVMFMLLTCLFMILEPLSVFAVNDIDNNKEKNLTVYFFVQKLGINKPIEGAEVGITKIADIEVKNGNIVYKVVEEFGELKGINFEGISVSESVNVARRFANIIKEYDKSLITDEAGKCTFNIEDNGVYLVTEIGVQKDATHFEKFEPYIILVPFIDDNCNEWTYEIISEPKTVVIQRSDDETSETEVSDEHDESSDIGVSDEHDESSDTEVSDEIVTDSDTVLTGDKTFAIVFVVAGCVSLLIMLILLLYRNRQVSDDE